ncbi:MAG: L-threonylcarbamoyladenylate synthase [Deltaproteobacteria bacterium]
MVRKKMDTLIRKVDADHPDDREIQEAARLIIRGGVVAYPTESYYGLGVNPEDAAAVERLFRAKERQRKHPILLLVDSPRTLAQLVREVLPPASRLMEAFWPGGLTLVFRASNCLLPAVTAGTGKVGIRISSHPVAAALAKAAGGMVTGTSANLSGKPPCCSTREVLGQLGGEVEMILDGGQTEGRTATTVLDVSVEPTQILREGMSSLRQLQEYL